MATGSYSCRSDRVGVTDAAAVRSLLRTYETHNQVRFTGDTISVSSQSDTFKVAGPNGDNAEKQFLTELAEYLEDRLVIVNEIEPPREPPNEGRWIIDPDTGVEYTA